MVKHRDCIDTIVRGVDAAVDAVDEATWASFLAYIAGSEGEVVLRAKLAIVIINVTHGARHWDVIIALYKAAQLMKTTDYLRCPSNRLDVMLQLLAIDNAAPPRAVVATLDLLPKLLETNDTLRAGMAAQYATRSLRHTDRTIRDAVLRVTPALMRDRLVFRQRAVNLGLLDLISEDPANEETEIRELAVRCLAQLCSTREDYSAALLTPRTLAPGDDGRPQWPRRSKRRRRCQRGICRFVHDTRHQVRSRRLRQSGTARNVPGAGRSGGNCVHIE
jgi:hypothetical protein